MTNISSIREHFSCISNIKFFPKHVRTKNKYLQNEKQ